MPHAALPALPCRFTGKVNLPASKTFTLHCSPAKAALLAEALTVYAHAAYPPGGSECAQVSHQALLDSARALSQSMGEAELRKRQRSIIKTAIAWYFSEEGPGSPELAPALLDLLAR